MRDLLFKCPECAASLAFDRKLAGKELSCPSCKAKIAVPIPDASFNCPSCNAGLHASADAEGEFECPACKGVIAIEGEAAADAARTEAGQPKLKLKDHPAERAKAALAPSSHWCPQCHAELANDAVICVRCGHDLRTGKAIQCPVGGDCSEEIPHPIGPLSTVMVWMIVAVPLVGSIVEWLARLGIPWQVYFVTNSVFCWIDDKNTERSGHEAPGGLWAALIPVYLWKRATLFSHRRRSYVWAWLGAFALSLAIDHYAGQMSSLETTAVSTVTEILTENLGGTAKCTSIELGKKLTNGIYQATASLDDGNKLKITVEKKGDQIEVTVPQLINYLVTVMKSAIASGNTAKIEQAQNMVAVYSRSLVKDAIADTKAENPTQDVITAVESVIGCESYFWSARAELFHDAGDDAPAEAFALYNEGVDAYDRKDYRQAIALYTRAIEKDAGFPWSLNNLAWTLATCPDKSLLDGTKAVDVAKSAIDAVGTNYWSFAGTLAAAYARCGDFTKALLWEQKAIDSAPTEKRGSEQLNLQSFRRGETLTIGEPPADIQNDGLAGIRQTLHSVLIPEFECRQANLNDIVDFLNAAYNEYAGPKGKVVSFVILPSKAASGSTPAAIPEVTMAARQIPLDTVLYLVAEAAGCRLETAGNVVALRPGTGPARSWDAEQSGDTADKAKMRQLLRSVIVPEVDFRQADIHDIAEFLGRVYRDVNPTNIVVNFVFIPHLVAGTPTRTPEVTMTARRINIESVLNVVAKAAGYSWTAEGNTVVIRLAAEESDGEPNIPQPSVEDKEVAKAAFELFGDGKDDPRFAGSADLLLLAKAVARVKARTTFPTMDECDALLDACGRLAARKLEPDIGRAVDGSRVLFEYERAMLSRGYQRYGGVFMDRASVDAHRRAAVEVQKAAHARVRDAASAQSNRGIATERVAKEFGDRKAADSYAKMQNKYFNSENRFYVKTRGKNWVVCVMDKGDRGATGQSAAMNRPGFKNFGYVDPYQGIPRFSKTVVASYPTYDAAYEAKKRRGASLSGPSDAMDEAVIYAGNAVAFTPPAPKYDIEYNAESKLWDLFMVRQ